MARSWLRDQGRVAALVAVVILANVASPTASAGPAFTFGTFTQSGAAPVFNYEGNNGSGLSELSDPNACMGTFQLNPAGFANPGSIPPTMSTALFYFDATSSSAATLGANNVVSQSFVSSTSLLRIEGFSPRETYVTLQGFSGTLSGVVGQSSATFSGSVVYDPTKAISSLPVSLAPGSIISFSMTLTNLTSPILLVAGSTNGPAAVFNDFQASDPTSVSSSIPLLYKGSVAEPGSIVSLLVGVTGIWCLGRRRRLIGWTDQKGTSVLTR